MRISHALLGIACAAGLAGAAQAIQVDVNGQPVAFAGVGPMQASGRVLVPLRGVLEQMGATVVWDPATRSITGSRGSQTFSLQLGNRQATMNGQATTLDVPAQLYSGTTMVPLRFVSEALGAHVGWDAVRQVVAIDTTSGASDAGNSGAQGSGRSGASLGRVISVNFRNNSVVVDENGLPTRYRVSGDAALVRGSGTGEQAIGLDAIQPGDTVRFRLDGRQQIVSLRDDTASPTPRRATSSSWQAPSITSFTHNGQSALRAGQELRVTLQGTPGGKASFDVVGVRTGVPMREVSPGTYTGRLAVPSGMALRDATVFGHLAVNGRAAPIIQSGQPVTVDTQPPSIAGISPANGATVTTARPDIYATLDDHGGSGVDPSSVRIRVNGQDVTSQAKVTPSFVLYSPPQPLPAGPVQVTINARDRAGNPATALAAFRVQPQAQGISAIHVSATRPLTAGEVLTVTARGAPGGNASFSLPGIAGSVPMTEQSPGDYVGTYTVRAGQRAFHVPARVTLRSATGQAFSGTASVPLDIEAAPASAPQILSPTAGTLLQGSVAVSGRTEPGARVRVSISYSARLLGFLNAQGQTATQTVTADARGNFHTPALSTALPLGVSHAQYTIQAVDVDSADKPVSPAATLRLR